MTTSKAILNHYPSTTATIVSLRRLLMSYPLSTRLTSKHQNSPDQWTARMHAFIEVCTHADDHFLKHWRLAELDYRANPIGSKIFLTNEANCTTQSEISSQKATRPPLHVLHHYPTVQQLLWRTKTHTFSHLVSFAGVIGYMWCIIWSTRHRILQTGNWGRISTTATTVVHTIFTHFLTRLMLEINSNEQSLWMVQSESCIHFSLQLS